MEWNRKPRNKSMNIRSTDLQQGCQEYTMGKELTLQQMVLGKVSIHMPKNEIEPLSYIIHKNQFKMN